MIRHGESVSLKIDQDIFDRIEKDYLPFKCDNPSPYVVFFAKKDGVAVSLFKNSKGEMSAVFQGEGATRAARVYDASATSSKPSNPNKPVKKIINRYPQIGSDEVGTGDFFGPIVVVAAYITESDLQRIDEFGIRDSKQLSDERIREIGPDIIKEFEFSCIKLDNQKYNKVHLKNNMNAIKAKMHNKALLNLKNKHQDAHCYIDQFTPEENYFSYLEGQKEILRDLTFSTKGESHFPSVALASVIARYAFLLEVDKLNEKYGMTFPHGAGKQVDEFAAEFLKKFGKTELKKIVKVDFSNYERLFNTSSK